MTQGYPPRRCFSTSPESRIPRRSATGPFAAGGVPPEAPSTGAHRDEDSVQLVEQERSRQVRFPAGSALLIGYARVSTDQQDLTVQRNGLAALGVGEDRIYVDHGLTGANRDRPGLRQALAACRAGDTLVVTKLDRLARSLGAAHADVRGRRVRVGNRLRTRR
jgi:hypothetical protein